MGAVRGRIVERAVREIIIFEALEGCGNISYVFRIFPCVFAVVVLCIFISFLSLFCMIFYLTVFCTKKKYQKWYTLRRVESIKQCGIPAKSHSSFEVIMLDLVEMSKCTQAV